MGMTDRVNNSLKTLLDTDDILYRKLICDKDGTIPSTITQPTDINIGIVASILEWLRLLSVDLKKQIQIDTASGEFLKYQLNEFFDSLQLEDETTTEWIQRTIAKVFQPKVSRASIIYALRPYSSPADPVISNLVQNSGFMDFSFMDAYNTATFTEVFTKVNYYTQTVKTTIGDTSGVLQYVPYVYSDYGFMDILYPTSFYELERRTFFTNEEVSGSSVDQIQVENIENNIVAIAYGDGSLIAISNSGFGRIKKSIDNGETWTAIEAPEDNEYVDIKYGNGVFIAIAKSGINNIIRSEDGGDTWTSVSAPNSIEFSSLAYGAGVWIAVAKTGSKRIIRSIDNGETWIEIDTPEINKFTGITFGDNTFVAVSEDGTSRSMRSIDFGLTWMAYTTPVNSKFQSIAFGNGVFVAIANDGSNRSIYSINNGQTWISSKTPTLSNFTKIIFGDDAFLAISDDGLSRIISSEDDGETWNNISTDEDRDWKGITFNGINFYSITDIGETLQIKRTFFDDVSTDQIVNVLPAIVGSYEGSFFSIKITLQNTPSEDVFTVQNIVDSIIAAGISYTIEIEYT